MGCYGMDRLTLRNYKYHDLDFMDSGLAEAMNKLAHYEDLEEQGRLIELPCKVGDTLYWVSKCYLRKQYAIAEVYYDTIDDILSAKDEFGKTLFLTREEAEAKLAELKEGGVDE